MVSYRLEIPKRVKLEVYTRAGGPGQLKCEGCGLLIGGKRFDYDHKQAEIFNTPKSQRTITADDVQILGYACCHQKKSSREHKDNCHGKRIVAKGAKAQKRKSRPMLGSRESPWKAKIGGGWERR